MQTVPSGSWAHLLTSAASSSSTLFLFSFNTFLPYVLSEAKLEKAAKSNSNQLPANEESEMAAL